MRPEEKRKLKEDRHYAEPDIRRDQPMKHDSKPEETRDEGVSRGANSEFEMHTVRFSVVPGDMTGFCVELLDGNAQIAAMSSPHLIRNGRVISL